MEVEEAIEGEAKPRGGRLLRHELGRTGALAVPVMIARSGALIMITADVIMTGRAGAGGPDPIARVPGLSCCMLIPTAAAPSCLRPPLRWRTLGTS